VDRIGQRNMLQSIIAPTREKSRAPGARSRFAQRLSRGVFREQGSALVETAVVMPILLLVMTGIFSFSIVIYQKLALAEGVSAGARFLAVDRGDTDPCASTAAKVYAAAPGLTSSKIKVTFVINGTAYDSATCSGTTGMVSGGTAKLTATYPCSFSVYEKSFGTCSLSESSSEAIQ